MSDHSNKDERLAGGNVSDVYRSGNTVRREMKPGSAKIHALLKHLEKKEFDCAPKFLGIDEKGREILSFIDGEAGNYPLKGYMWADDNLVEIARMLRSYHDAVRDFPIGGRWKPLDRTPDKQEIICHNDFAIYNIIFNNKKPAGIIDFDMAAPGPVLWDMAYTLYTCVPLSRFRLTEEGDRVDYQSALHAEGIKRRVVLFFTAYGEEIPKDLIKVVLQRLEGLCQTMTRKAREGDAAFQNMISEGHLKHYEKDMDFIRKHAGEWV